MMLTRRTLAGSALAVAFTASLPLTVLAAQKLTVKSVGSDRKVSEVELPADPKRIAALDPSVLENLQFLGVGDRVVAAVRPETLSWLAPLPAGAVTIESMKTVDVPAVKATNPDVIFISGRISRAAAEFSAVAPTACLVVDYARGAWATYTENLTALARLFGQNAEAKAKDALARDEKRVAAIKAKAAGEKIAILMMIGGSVFPLADGGRCSLLTDALGFVNVKPRPTEPAEPRKKGPAPGERKKPTDAEIAAGNRKTFEALRDLAPSRIFVLNKDAAVGVKGAKAFADAVKDDPVWAALPAVKAGRVTELTGSAWYLGEGGVASTGRMLADVEKALGL
ncbi:ABC transporter substrate-binding protein [Sutterella sp.]|uniref:ABC transporter substrate-binding protein n=1 Tax=Sutterella sp. TaxID=1981025 RepID=UPI0026E10EA6|nr:ABC transporter substrate-binding protein [Sutterella sp.]MDO5531128.1 ABC transporter substrate-binding protein [Sutterella sp.]